MADMPRKKLSTRAAPARRRTRMCSGGLFRATMTAVYRSPAPPMGRAAAPGSPRARTIARMALALGSKTSPEFGAPVGPCYFSRMVTGSPPAARVAGADPVVICCASDEVTELREVVRKLQARGNAVELVSDAATDPKSLEPRVARWGDQAIYVLCRSEGLTRAGIDALRDVLLAHRVPFGRTLTVASMGTQELLERIENALRRVGASRSRTLAPASGAPGPARPTMLGVPVPRPGPTADARAVPSEVAPDDSSPTGAGTHHDDTVADGVSEPAGAANEETVAGAAAAERTTSKPRGPIEFDELTTLEVPHTWVEQEEQDHERRRRTSAPARRPPPPPPPTPSAASAEDSLANAPLITAEDLADLASDSGPIEVGSAEGARAFGPPSRVLITGDTVIARLVGDGGHEPPPALPSTARSAPARPPVTSPLPAVAAPLASEDPDPPVSSASPAPLPSPDSARTRTTLWLGVGTLGLAVLLGLGWVVLHGQDPATKTASVDQTEAPGEGVQEAAPHEDATEPEDDLPDASLPGQLETAVMAALRKRELRALDVLLVANEEGPSLEYSDAETYCRTLQIAGLMAWRLPEVGELASMTDAGLVGGAIYWSRTPADTFGDTRLAWHGKLKRVLQRDGTSRALCVRGDHAAR